VKAGTVDVDKVRAAMSGQTFSAPSGFTLKLDETNHHLWKPVMIGEVQANGQFDVVWKTPGPVRAEPWSPFIPHAEKHAEK
jgi:urea transport system substrate-binding protein